MNHTARALAGVTFAAFAAFAVTATFPHPAAAEDLAEVSTAFRWLGKNDRVVIEAYDDPKVHGTCHYP